MPQSKSLLIYFFIFLFFLSSCAKEEEEESDLIIPMISSPTKIGTETNWISISGGFYHTVALNSEGEIYSWGRNDYGQIGNGDGGGSNVNSPTQVGPSSDWIAIDAGDFHNIAINSNGELYTWGANDSGQIGNGSYGPESSIDSPLRIGTATNWTKVVAGGNHSLAINSNGELYAWGNNTYGSVGNGGSGESIYSGRTIAVTSPEKIGTATNWTYIAAGQSHSMAINSDGELYIWGGNDSGEIGNGEGGGSYSVADGPFVTSPVKIGSATNWTKVDGGSNHTLALTSDHTIYTWGGDSKGQLGNGGCVAEDQTTPLLLESSMEWASVSTGNFHSFAINTSGELYAWGWTYEGRLGNGSTSDSSRHSPIKIGENSNWVHIDGGFHHSVALNSAGEIYTWGSDQYGQIGNN